MSGVYCAAPFNSIRIDAVNSDQSLYRPCCMYRGNQIYKNVSEYINSVELSDLKNHFLNGSNFLPGCRACEQQENQGQTSWRQHFNQKFKDQQQITQLELFPGNVCNLKCFMCFEGNSTALGAELKKLNFIEDYKEIDNANTCIDSIKNLPGLTDVSFIGGEFFLTKKNLEILDLIIHRGLGIRLVTNATIVLPQYIERLKKINRLELQISIDGISDSYEFMRYPADWNTVNHNIQMFKTQLTHAKINFNFVVQPLNIQYMIPTLDYSNKLLIPMRLTNLVDPSWLTWQILNNYEKTLLVDLLDQQLVQYKLTSQQQQEIINYQQTIQNATFSQDLREIFKTRMGIILQHREISQDKIHKHLAKLTTLLL